MGFGPMMSSLMRNKTGPMLVALQIAVTLAIVVNSLYIVVQRVEKINRDSGIDVGNVIITYVRGFGEDFDVVDSITNDIHLIKSIPGVVAATVSNHVPLSGSGSGTGLRTVADETVDAVFTARYRWSEEGLDALGIELSRGRNFFPEEVDYILPASAPPGAGFHPGNTGTRGGFVRRRGCARQDGVLGRHGAINYRRHHWPHAWLVGELGQAC